MPKFEIWDGLIRPIGERLIADERFGAAGINVFYDRRDKEIVEQRLMPCVNYFLQPNWSDTTRGSNTVTLQDRRMRAEIGFGLWSASTDIEQLDKALFLMAGNLIDFLREATEWDRAAGISVVGVINWTPVDSFGDENNIVGTQRVVATFELFSGAGV